MTPSPLQLNLAIQLPVSRPLVPMEAAMVILDRDQDDVLGMIENGRLSWAWNIATQGAERREVRIWRDCLVSHVNGAAQPDAADGRPVISAVVPHHTELKSTELQRLFTASQGHIQHLIEQGLLRGLNVAKAGPNGFVRVTRESVLTFLQSRRII